MYLVFFMLLALFSCSSTTKFITMDEFISARSDTTAGNYKLFKYINGLTAKDYYTLLKRVKRGDSLDASDFFTLRMAYTKTKEYSPYAETVERQRRIRKYLFSSPDYKKAITIADSTLSSDYVDIKSHFYCTVAYDLLGDSLKAEFHAKIFRNLIGSIFLSGNGKSPKNAFIVICVGEEYSLLEALGLSVDEQALISQDGSYFDLLEVSDKEKKTRKKIYFNIDLPFNEMSRRISHRLSRDSL